jgi:hypothetical protein
LISGIRGNTRRCSGKRQNSHFAVLEFSKVDTYPTKYRFLEFGEIPEGVRGKGRTPILQFWNLAKWALIRQSIDFWNSGKYPKGFGEKAELENWRTAELQKCSNPEMQ